MKTRAPRMLYFTGARAVLFVDAECPPSRQPYRSSGTVT